MQLQKADPNYGVGINPISRLIQIQQAKREKEPVYALVAEKGLPRRREFVMEVSLAASCAAYVTVPVRLGQSLTELNQSIVKLLFFFFNLACCLLLLGWTS